MLNLMVFGDIHTNLGGVRKIMKDFEADYYISTGDLSLYSNLHYACQDKKSMKHDKNAILNVIDELDNGTFVPLSKPLYLVKGNHDQHYDPVFEKYNIFYLKNGLHVFNGINIAAFGGIYSSVQINNDENTFVERQSRFFTHNELDAIKQTFDNIKCKILFTHQAGLGILPAYVNDKMDEGIKEISDLINTLKPDYYIHGHHHANYKKLYKSNIQVIGMGNFSTDYTSYTNILI